MGLFLAANEKFRAEATYEIGTIRMTAKDATTEAVTCEAVLIAEMPKYRQEQPIRYKIENTTDGKLYATVWGLQ